MEHNQNCRWNLDRTLEGIWLCFVGYILSVTLWLCSVCISSVRCSGHALSKFRLWFPLCSIYIPCSNHIPSIYGPSMIPVMFCWIRFGYLQTMFCLQLRLWLRPCLVYVPSMFCLCSCYIPSMVPSMFRLQFCLCSGFLLSTVPSMCLNSNDSGKHWNVTSQPSHK